VRAFALRLFSVEVGGKLGGKSRRSDGVDVEACVLVKVW
jgi:hypothetical protein